LKLDRQVLPILAGLEKPVKPKSIFGKVKMIARRLRKPPKRICKSSPPRQTELTIFTVGRH
jgi:hypothetical protein